MPADYCGWCGFADCDGTCTADDPREDPDERAIPREAQVSAEEVIAEGFGLPEVWRCPCGGRPFVTESTCPRCGRKQGERWS